MPSLEPPAKPVLEPDPENIAHVAQVARDQLQAAVRIVAPRNRHLLDAVPEAPCDRQNLHIEHVAIDLLPPEELLRGLAREEFEPALRILNSRQPHHGVHENRKSLRSDLPVERLFLFDFGAAAPRPEI